MLTNNAIKFLLPIVAGVVGAILLLKNVHPPEKSSDTVKPKAVQVISIQPRLFEPLITTTGSIAASDTWRSVSQVRGEIIWASDQFELGRWIKQGEELLRIDPSEYELAVTQIEADLAGIKHELGLLESEAQNTQRILSIESRQLNLANDDLKRIRVLFDSNSATRKQLDDVERAVLLADKVVTELENALALVEPRRLKLLAQRQSAETALDRAKRDLDHTHIKAPFDLRITKIAVDPYQAVNNGQLLMEGVGVQSVDIVAQLDVSLFTSLIDVATIDEPSNQVIINTLNQQLTAEIHTLSQDSQTWKAQIISVRTELDNQTRTLQMVLQIANPYSLGNYDRRLPLLLNQPVKLTLSAKPRSSVLIPASAVHGQTVYLLDAENKLEIRSVILGLKQGSNIQVLAGIEPQERLIIDQLVPALPGKELLGVEVSE